MTEPLWEPSPERIAQSQLRRFMDFLRTTRGLDFNDYHELYGWSVTAIRDFWQSIWEFADILHSQPYERIVDRDQMWDARWFEGVRLNFAENLLRYRDEHTAIIHWCEHRDPRHISYEQLHRDVANLQTGLRSLGVQPGDRVAGFMPNIPETVMAMLATTASGAIWSSCSPDFGFQGVLDRFGQIKPRVLFTADGYQYGGKRFDSLDRVAQIVKAIPSIEIVVIVPYLETTPKTELPKSVLLPALMDQGASAIDFVQNDFDHPVYIMYSSGTTGKPKCMVHGAGGTLLQHYKEHVLHTDLTRDDTVFYFTTCGWMMWNWLISALQVGSTVFLCDGSPAHPDPDVLWSACEQEGISVFGTSPKYLTTCQQAEMSPGSSHDLTRLRAILSTGSPLLEANFNWVYNHVKSDVQLASISGGTDIVSCFVLGCPILPVYPGEIQCRGLGMKVETYNDTGESVTGEVGELVCTAPFPSRPVYFYDDPDGERYHRAYYDHFPGVWRHGDFIEITERGSVVVYGRSDATLNPGGVRIGTAEIYGPVEETEEVVDSLVVGQQWQGDVRIVLFVVLQRGLALDDELAEKIRLQIRRLQTPRHVPAKIIQVEQIPHTINGKKVELAVSNIIHGKPVSNREALANPESLDQFTDIPQLSTP
ncbi:acetoacetate--CoA ligase [candidate division GN15 bacterium]|nr:acetoacetate--CoA ligase [candidate division GN15 bacterium]